MNRLPLRLIFLILPFTLAWFPQPIFGAPKPDLWPYWEAHDESNTETIDHSVWQHFLDRYLKTDDPSGIIRVSYASVKEEDKILLSGYIETLQQIEITNYNRTEQLAFWINLYNALTVKVVLDHYPVKSIREIDISPGLLSSGPWDAQLLSIQANPVSLNDIEHRILRPIYKDNRIHYVLNCASIGCPDLQPFAFTSGNTFELLERSAIEYVNDARGAVFTGKRLELSSIYSWYREDFGRTEKGVINHLSEYAEDELRQRLKTFNGRVVYKYDWSLNE